MKNLAPIWHGNIEDGKLTIANQEMFEKYLSSLRGEVEMIVRKWKKKRTDNQNRYYWGVIVPLLCDSLGYYDEEMHEALKWKFLRNKEREKLPTVKSTVSLSTIEFKNYIERIITWAAEQGIIIPDPTQIEYDNTAIQ